MASPAAWLKARTASCFTVGKGSAEEGVVDRPEPHEQRGDAEHRSGGRGSSSAPGPNRRLRPRGRRRTREGGSVLELFRGLLQLSGEIAGGGVAIPRPLGEASRDDLAEGRWRRGVQGDHGLGLRLDDGGEGLHRALAAERAVARRDLVEDRAEGELVAPEVHRLPPGLLRRHVAGGAEDRSGVGVGALEGEGLGGGRLAVRVRRLLPRTRGDELGQAEVQQLDPAVPRDHHVLRLEVAVDDPRGMGLREAFGDLRRVVEGRPAEGGPSPGEERPQRAAVHQLHHDVGPAVVVADLVDRHDVRVVEGGGRARFLLEADQAIRVRGDVPRQDLDGHLTTEVQVLRPVHLPHAAGAQLLADLVVSDRLADLDHDRLTPSAWLGTAKRSPDGSRVNDRWSRIERS